MYRLTTHEAASELGCTREQALQLLKAADIPHGFAGSGYLWAGEAVCELCLALRRSRGDGSVDVDEPFNPEGQRQHAARHNERHS